LRKTIAEMSSPQKDKRSGKGAFDKFIKKPSDGGSKALRKKKKPEYKDKKSYIDPTPIRLNRFISHAGVCSRRQADELIREGKVKVNGKVVKELGIKVNPQKDNVVYNNKALKLSNFVYLLMNKPKNHITTLKDEMGRKTVMDIARQYTQVRIFPVGRLDRNTTGLLLFTNDGELAEKLTHPSNNIKKLFHSGI